MHVQVDGSTGNKFQSVAELIATEKAARAARGGGVQVSEEETVSGTGSCNSRCSVTNSMGTTCLLSMTRRAGIDGLVNHPQLLDGSRAER